MNSKIKVIAILISFTFYSYSQISVSINNAVRSTDSQNLSYYYLTGLNDRKENVIKFAKNNNLTILELKEGTVEAFKYGEAYLPVVYIKFRKNTEYLSEVKYQEQEMKNKEIEKENKIKEEKAFRESTIAKNESAYRLSIENAKKITASKGGNYSVIEYSDGFYVGEVKNGMRDGYGELYYKNILPSNEITKKNISQIGKWKNNKENGYGVFIHSKLELTYGIFGMGINQWVEYRSECNFDNGLQNGEGIFQKGDERSHVLFENGKIVRNYTKEEYERNKNNRINNINKTGICWKFLRTTNLNYNSSQYTGKVYENIKNKDYITIFYFEGNDTKKAGWYYYDSGMITTHVGYSGETEEEALILQTNCK
jgi:hypothetical protein